VGQCDRLYERGRAMAEFRGLRMTEWRLHFDAILGRKAMCNMVKWLSFAWQHERLIERSTL